MKKSKTLTTLLSPHSAIQLVAISCQERQAARGLGGMNEKKAV